MMHDLSSRRVRLIGRNHTTPVYHPVQERETIAPMHGSEFEGPGAVPAIVLAAAIGIILWATFFGALFS